MVSAGLGLLITIMDSNRIGVVFGRYYNAGTVYSADGAQTLQPSQFLRSKYLAVVAFLIFWVLRLLIAIDFQKVFENVCYCC